MPAISWSSVKTLKCFESFAECSELGQRTQYIGRPNSHQNTLDLVLSINLTPNNLSIGKTFPSSDRNIIIYSLGNESYN